MDKIEKKETPGWKQEQLRSNPILRHAIVQWKNSPGGKDHAQRVAADAQAQEQAAQRSAPKGDSALSKFFTFTVRPDPNEIVVVVVGASG